MMFVGCIGLEDEPQWDRGKEAGLEGEEGGRIDVCEACVCEREGRGEGGGRASPSKGLAFVLCVAFGLVWWGGYG